MKKIEVILGIIQTMDWNKRDALPYFCAGALFALGMLDENVDEIKDALTEAEAGKKEAEEETA